MEPSAVGVSFLAVARALYARHLTPQSAAAVVLVVLEAHSVHLIVVQGGAVRFLRTAPLSGDVLDEAARGVPTLASEIRSVLDFYGTQTDDLPEVRGVVVWTGRNAPASISADLSRALGGMPVTVSSPTSISEDAGLLSENGLSRATACAVGLAMRGLGETAFPANLNLLPTATVRVQTLKKRALVTAILAASLFFLALLGMGAVHLRLTALNREMGRTRKSLATVVYPPSAQVVKSEIARISDELQVRDACLRSAGTGVPWPQVLLDIKERTPHDMRLTSLKAARSNELTVDGESLSLGSVYRFAEQLADSDLIRSARLANVETVIRDERAMSIYRIDCRLGAVSERER